MSQILNTIHDLLNKHTILFYHIQRAKEDNQHISPEKIEPVVTRIGELINDLCLYHKEANLHKSPFTEHSLNDFFNLLQTYVDKLNKIFLGTHIYLLYELTDKTSHVCVEDHLLYQVIENIIENSVNAGKSVISLEVKEEKELITLTIIDCKKINHTKPKRAPSLPNGMGTNIIIENMDKMNAKILKKSINEDSFTIILGFPLVRIN